VIGLRFEERNQTDLADDWLKELITVFDPDQITVLFLYLRAQNRGWSLNAAYGICERGHNHLPT